MPAASQIARWRWSSVTSSGGGSGVGAATAGRGWFGWRASGGTGVASGFGMPAQPARTRAAASAATMSLGMALRRIGSARRFRCDRPVGVRDHLHVLDPAFVDRHAGPREAGLVAAIRRRARVEEPEPRWAGGLADHR